MVLNDKNGGRAMNAMVVGADRLGNIPDALSSLGIRIAYHVTGRDSSHQRKVAGLPTGIDLVILFTDFLGHNVMKSFRQVARDEGVRVVVCKRSVCSVMRALECHGLASLKGARCTECPRK
jgi:hypothetical protein